MSGVRQRIERRVFSVNGLSLQEFDLSQPPGDPGLYGPDSVIWRVHGDFTSMLCGGISALLLQMRHPLALAGVWDHSRFRDDMLGRLRRTSQFIAVTTFGNTADAQTLIERVRQIHLRVSGQDRDGTPYAASDPDLLTWVHVAEAHAFLTAHLRYKNPRLSLHDQNQYYAEAARVAAALGARAIPETVTDVADYLQGMRPRLRYDDRTHEVTRILMNAPAPGSGPGARLATRAFLQAGIDLLPAWAQPPAPYALSPLARRAVRAQVMALAAVLRWSIRRSAYSRAMQRMGRDF
ncbi:oxygenase MpaB family protein [Pantoea sp. 1.19]|uniref:oxygenase MpaB family protein n=1 Tax=Pantoea sp. 1.19 TaxID=1925589 RepID=UPI000948C0D2|nr:oxygenase MpaB family protein [Pantoea sp. 1.19]